MAHNKIHHLVSTLSLSLHVFDHHILSQSQMTHLETDTGNITDGVTLTTETGDQHLIVLLNVVQATVTGHERGDLLAVLDQLHTNALPDSGIRLLSLDTAAQIEKE